MSAIYARARAVIVWLGEADGDSAHAVEFMRRMYNSMRAEWQGVFPGLRRGKETLGAFLSSRASDRALDQPGSVDVYLASYDEYARYYRILLEALHEPWVLREPAMKQWRWERSRSMARSPAFTTWAPRPRRAGEGPAGR